MYNSYKDKKVKQATTKEAIEVLNDFKTMVKGEEAMKAVKGIVNEKSIEGLLTTTATEEDYEELAEFIVEEAKNKYEQFKFTLMKPKSGDYTSGYALRIIFDPSEDWDVHQSIFKFIVDRGLDEVELNHYVSELVQEGDIIPLGDILVDDEGTGISSPLSGEPIQFFVVFEDEEYKERRLEAEEVKEQLEKEKAEKAAKQQEVYREAHKQMTIASALLQQLGEKLVEENPEFVEAYESVKSMFEER